MIRPDGAPKAMRRQLIGKKNERKAHAVLSCMRPGRWLQIGAQVFPKGAAVNRPAMQNKVQVGRTAVVQRKPADNVQALLRSCARFC